DILRLLAGNQFDDLGYLNLAFVIQINGFSTDPRADLVACGAVFRIPQRLINHDPTSLQARGGRAPQQGILVVDFEAGIVGSTLKVKREPHFAIRVEVFVLGNVLRLIGILWQSEPKTKTLRP